MSCMANLQNIGAALKMYRMDERQYPPALYGYQEEDKKDASGALVPTTFLYKHYIRGKRDFVCPDNPVRDDFGLYTRVFSGTSSPQQAVPLKRVPKAGGSYDLKPVTDARIAYFAFDSYDGGFVPPKSYKDSSKWELHYRRDWASLSGDPDNLDRELLDRNPEDSAYVTTCSSHRIYNGDGTLNRYSLDMVLFLDGRVEKRPTAECSWKMAPK